MRWMYVVRTSPSTYKPINYDSINFTMCIERAADIYLYTTYQEPLSKNWITRGKISFWIYATNTHTHSKNNREKNMWINCIRFRRHGDLNEIEWIKYKKLFEEERMRKKKSIVLAHKVNKNPVRYTHANTIIEFVNMLL